MVATLQGSQEGIIITLLTKLRDRRNLIVSCSALSSNVQSFTLFHKVQALRLLNSDYGNFK